MRKPAIGRAAAPRDGGSPGVAMLGGSSARSGAMAGDGPATDKTRAEVRGGRVQDLNGSRRVR
jgi:hypothetical protein